MDLTQKRILVVDDEEEIRNLLRRAIERQLGSQVDLAASGLEALEQIRVNHYNLMVTDLSMPEMDGLSLFKAVKERHPDIQVIVLTAAPSLESSMAAVKSHVFSYLAKPLAIDRFIKEVQSALQEQENQANAEGERPKDLAAVLQLVESSADEILARAETLGGQIPITTAMELKNLLVRHREHLRYLRMLVEAR